MFGTSGFDGNLSSDTGKSAGAGVRLGTVADHRRLRKLLEGNSCLVQLGDALANLAQLPPVILSALAQACSGATQDVLGATGYKIRRRIY